MFIHSVQLRCGEAMTVTEQYEDSVSSSVGAREDWKIQQEWGGEQVVRGLMFEAVRTNRASLYRAK